MIREFTEAKKAITSPTAAQQSLAIERFFALSVQTPSLQPDIVKVLKAVRQYSESQKIITAAELTLGVIMDNPRYAKELGETTPSHPGLIMALTKLPLPQIKG